MATLLLFGPARQAAGTRCVQIDGATVGEVCQIACDRFGPAFAAVARESALWRNGEPARDDEPVGTSDEVAVVPPVSGG